MSALAQKVVNGSRLLVVDDDLKILRVAHRMLYADWEVETANSVPEALRMLSTRQYDVVLSDWDMPDGGGWAIVEGAKGKAPVVIHSGANPEVIKNIVGGKMAGFIAKPASLDGINAALTQAIHNSKP